MNSILEVFLYFLKLGTTGFGGPVALVAIMQKELVEEKAWMSKEKFIQVLPLLKAMPGAFSFQTAVYLGNQRAGRWAGFLAGLALILPASILMILLGVFLKQYGENLELKFWIQGFQWGAIVLMAGAVESLSKSYWSDKNFWLLLFLSTLTAVLFETSEIYLVMFFGIMSMALEKVKFSIFGKFNSFLFGLGGLTAGVLAPSILSLFLICFSSGAFVFGTGIAIAPLLEKYFVIQYQWINHEEFMTALALSQMTPGPVMVIVTLIGYKTLGVLGAIVATLAVYSPGWIHMLTWFPKVSDKLIQSKPIQFFLKGALAAVVASISLTLFNMCKIGSFNMVGIPIVLLLFYLNRKIKIKSWQLILLSGVIFRVAMFVKDLTSS